MGNACTVGVPFEFFRKVRGDYKDWRFALIRELIQNSVDAGARRIDMSLEKVNGKTRFTVLDNGKGMTRSVLLDVFMELGGSKKNAGAIGGFGMAKMVIFSCDRYVVQTKDTQVIGRGGEYAWEPLALGPKGVSVSVEIDVDDYSTMETKIRDFVSTCWLQNFRDVSLYLNGEELSQDSVEYDFETEIAGMPVYYSKNQSSSFCAYTWVVQGLPMFTTTDYNAGGAGFIARVELGPVNPLETFTTNRDGFLGSMDDRTKALATSLKNSVTPVTYGSVVAYRMNQQQHYSREELPTSTYDPVRPNYPANFMIRCDGYETRRTAKKQCYMSGPELLAHLDKVKVARIARMWEAACKLVLMTDAATAAGVKVYKALGSEYNEERDEDVEVGDCQFSFLGKPLLFGFAYVPGYEGMLAGKQFIYMNPKTLADDWYPLDLYDLALHECAHLWEANHGENFMMMESRLRRSMYRWMTMREVEKTIVAAGQKE